MFHILVYDNVIELIESSLINCLIRQSSCIVLFVFICFMLHSFFSYDKRQTCIMAEFNIIMGTFVQWVSYMKFAKAYWFYMFYAYTLSRDIYLVRNWCNLLKYPRNFFIIYFTYLSCRNLCIIYVGDEGKAKAFAWKFWEHPLVL